MQLLTFILHTREPVLVTAPGGDPNSEDSLGYIPGSVVRGALATRYEPQISHQGSQRFLDLFINGRIRFLNAYPAPVDPSSHQLHPTPPIWQILKGIDQGPIHNWLHDENTSGKQLESLKKPFIELHPGKNHAWKREPLYEIAIHTARNRRLGRSIDNDQDADSALFRYRALAAEQTFKGTILIGDNAPDDAVDILRELLGNSLLLGGSQSAGYGLTAVHNVECQERPLTMLKPIPAGQPFILFLESDAILRHPETGQPTNNIANYLSPYFPGTQLTTIRCHTSMTWVGGFNTAWGLPLPQEWAVAKGSLWQLHADHPLPAQQLQALLNTGIGRRRAEGFGQLAINPSWLTQRYELQEQGSEPVGKPALPTNPPNVIQSSHALLVQMNQRLAQRELDRLLVAKAQELARKTSGHLSNSQVARLRLRVRQADVGFANFRQYLDTTQARKSANDQFRKFKLNGRNFRQWLYDITEDSSTIWTIIDKENKWQPPQIGAVPFDRRAVAHVTTIRLIDAVCEQLAKRPRSNEWQ